MKENISWASILNGEAKRGNKTSESVTEILTQDWYAKISIPWDDSNWKKIIIEKMWDESLSEKERAHYRRMFNVLNMPNLCNIEGNPINMVVNRMLNSPFFHWFDRVDVPEMVNEWATFDLFNFPEDHVARRPTDSYFVNKSENKKESVLLRPHTSVMWYYNFLEGNGLKKLHESWEIRSLSYWKVYRVDELDKSHHECFHQIDWLRVTSKEKEIITQETLKNVLSNIIKTLFWEDVKFRLNEDSFPYTTDSLEVEVDFKGKWIEVLWAGIVHPNVFEKLWIDPEKYNWWAFGFWIERLAMPLKGISDIRVFWSEDKRITKQWGDFEAYKEVSAYPPVYKDISIIVPKKSFIKDVKEEEKSWELELTRNTESDFFAITWVIRDVWWDLIEEVKIIDIYENDKKFWENNKSLSMKIVFRSIERTLTNEEINKMYFEIRGKIEREIWYTLR